MMDNESQPLPRDKDELLQRIQRSRAALEQTISQLSDAQLVAPGPSEGWSARDHLAHLTIWEQGLAALLQGHPRYTTMGLDEQTYLNTDEVGLNEIIYQHNKDRSLTEVLAAFQQAHQQVLAALAGLTDADLFLTYSHDQPDEPGEDSGAPILGWIAGNTYDHYAEHQAWIQALV
ncbi:MAG: DinB family protein [Dehalococcoidia bacterium]